MALKVATNTLVNAKTPYAAAPTSTASLRASRVPFAETLARDIETAFARLTEHDKIFRQNSPEVREITVTDATGRVIAAFGPHVYSGVPVVNYLSEAHFGGSGDPSLAIVDVNPDGTVTIGQNGSVRVLDPYADEAAWVGTEFDTQAVVSVADNGSGLIRLEITGHTLATNDVVWVYGVPNGTGERTVTSIDPNHVDLQDTVYVAGYVSGGSVDRLLHVSSVADNGSGLIRIGTAVAHTYESGDRVNLAGCGDANGRWNLTVADSTHFDLDGSSYGGSYSNGACLRFFAGGLFQTIAIGPSFTNYRLRAFADGSLRIRNAIIELTGAGGTITLDPDVPEITLTDASGTEDVSIGVTQEAGLAVTAATNASPVEMTVPGNTYVDGDTIYVSGATGNTAINGYRIVTNAGVAGAGKFNMTDLAGAAINGNGAYAGSATAARYYAGILTQVIAIGDSFTGYNFRAFADGSIEIIDATIEISGNAPGGTPQILTLGPTLGNAVKTVATAGAFTSTSTLNGADLTIIDAVSGVTESAAIYNAYSIESVNVGPPNTKAILSSRIGLWLGNSSAPTNLIDQNAEYGATILFNIDGTYDIGAITDNRPNDIYAANSIQTPNVKFTPEGGLAVLMINKTGAASVKGTLIEPSTVDYGFGLTPVDSADIAGIVYDDGIADGSPCWVVVSGYADVNFVGTAVLGNLARMCVAADTGAAAGYAVSDTYPSPPFATDKHFQEVGHVAQGHTGAGLARCLIHFN